MPLKTKNKMINYVVSIVDKDTFEGSQKDQFKEVYSNFDNEYNFPQNKQRYPNFQLRFSEWLRGLPTGLNFVFYNYDILELAKKQGILSNNPKEKEEQKILDNYWMYLSMTFMKIFRILKIELNY